MNRPARCLVALVALLSPVVACAKKPPPEPVGPPAEIYRDQVARLIGGALASDDAMEELVELCDTIGHRLSGSESLDRAIAWAQAEMTADGLTNVRAEPVLVPRWVRGTESMRMIEPIARPLPMLGLGGSVGTPDGPIRGEVVVADSFEHLENLGEASVRGKIVLFDVPFTTYGETVQYRTAGAVAAAKLGAVASMVRSVGPTSLSTPHTGATRYDDAVPKIPHAAITLEDAATIRRLAERGRRVVVEVQMAATTLDDVPSANVVGEIRGREAPNEVVVLGCHLDSWDVGQGAQDDGAGCVAAMEVVRLLGTLDRPPRRTVRAVLYTNEENGLAGGRGYLEAHQTEVGDHVAAIEMDTGAGRPQGFRVDVRAGEASEAEGQRILAWLQQVRPLLRAIDADELMLAYSGADVGPLADAGVLAFGVHMDTTGYWPIHHTHADTIDKIDPENLKRNVAAMAVLAFVLAEVPEPPRVSR